MIVPKRQQNDDILIQSVNEKTEVTRHLGEFYEKL